jgi:hypothetical protein
MIPLMLVGAVAVALISGMLAGRRRRADRPRHREEPVPAVEAPRTLRRSSMRVSMKIALLTVCLWLGAVAAATATELQWWSHWAIEDNKKIVLFEAKKRFEAKNPGHTVALTFTRRRTCSRRSRPRSPAGSGFPDVLYYDIDAPEFMQAGWMADLSHGVRWENIEPFGKAFWTRPGAGGKTGVWALPLEAASDELYYNKKIFKQLGVTVPANGSLHPGAVQGLVGKCAKAGYAAFATGAADRDWAAHYMPNAMLLDKLGSEDTLKLFRGELSWKDPRVVEVFHYYKELIDLGAYAKTLSQHDAGRGAPLLPHRAEGLHVPGRLLVHRPRVRGAGQGRPAEGLRAGHDEQPAMKDGKGHNQKFLGVAGSLGAPPRAQPAAGHQGGRCVRRRRDRQPVDGQTGVQTGIKTDRPRSTARSSGTSTSTRA